MHVNPGSNTTVTLKTNLAIVSSGTAATGAIDLGNNSGWVGSGGTRKLFFMSPYNGTAADCPSQNLTVQNQNTFTGASRCRSTAPCTLNIANNSGLQRSGDRRTVVETSTSPLSYKPC